MQCYLKGGANRTLVPLNGSTAGYCSKGPTEQANISVLEAGGFADIAAHEAFCPLGDCVIATVFDQSPQGNHLAQRISDGVVHNMGLVVIAKPIHALQKLPAAAVVGYRALHAVERPVVLRVKRTHSAVGGYARVARSCENVTWAAACTAAPVSACESSSQHREDAQVHRSR